MLFRKKKLEHLYRFTSVLFFCTVVFDDVVSYLPQIAGVVTIVTYILNMIYKYRYTERGKKYTFDMILSVGAMCLSIYTTVS